KGSIMQAYIQASEADGASYIMPDYFRDLLFLSQTLTKEQEALLDYENALEIVDRSSAHPSDPIYTYYTEEAIAKAKKIVALPKPTAVLQVLKPQGFGFTVENGLAAPSMLKKSSIPLTWSRVKNNPNML